MENYFISLMWYKKQKGGRKIRKNKQWYEEHKEVILQKYYDNIKVHDISNELDCNYSMLYRKFKEWGIKRRYIKKKSIRSNAIYNIDYTYFNVINTEHKAYWLGFLLADGYVNEREIMFCLQKNDVNMIKLFLYDLKANYPIKYNKDNNPYVIITCRDLSKTLLEKGFHHRKSWKFDLETLLPYIPIELERHFIRGMFDGDGCIKYYIYPYLNKPQYHFGYTGLENICNYIKNKFGIDRKLVHEGNLTYTVVTRNPNKINEIYEYLYKDATIYMDRKYKIFKEIKMMTFNDYNKAIS